MEEKGVMRKSVPVHVLQVDWCTSWQKKRKDMQKKKYYNARGLKVKSREKEKKIWNFITSTKQTPY